MSMAPSPISATGLPAVNQATEPEWVRRGSASTQRAYDTALAFEQTLVEQLARSLTDSSGVTGEGSEAGEEGSGDEGQAGMMSSMLPQALASGVISGGGLGLAAQLTQSLQGAGADAPTTSTQAQPQTQPQSTAAPAAGGSTAPATTGGSAASTGGAGA
jgi:Rod binding domain-containing protein